MENMAEGEEGFPCRVRGYSPGFLYLPCDALVTNLMNPKATFFFVALSAPLLEKNHDPSYALFIGFLIVATGTAGWILWALVFRWQPIRFFYGRYAGILDGILSLVLAGFGFSMLYSFGRMAVENFS